mmetsp:Transcript_20218/g.38121  ORF Transcript_20218/g.38121 Transcript_20218/m.38121 type:complete len:273 (-) Transcript_20218:1389-2207(-)
MKSIVLLYCEHAYFTLPKLNTLKENTGAQYNSKHQRHPPYPCTFHSPISRIKQHGILTGIRPLRHTRRARKLDARPIAPPRLQTVVPVLLRRPAFAIRHPREIGPRRVIVPLSESRVLDVGHQHVGHSHVRSYEARSFDDVGGFRHHRVGTRTASLLGCRRRDGFGRAAPGTRHDDRRYLHFVLRKHRAIHDRIIVVHEHHGLGVVFLEETVGHGEGVGGGDEARDVITCDVVIGEFRVGDFDAAAVEVVLAGGVVVVGDEAVLGDGISSIV